MKIFVVTLFPEVLEPYLGASIMKKAQELGAVTFELVQLREFGLGRHKQVDDYPYGGGAGMLLRPEPVFAAVDHLVQREGKKPTTLLLSPQGERFHQARARDLAGHASLLFLCGHYEGVDERIRSLADQEISLGDYVLTGGELGALVVIDAVVRLLPGVLPPESLEHESFAQGLLEYAQYTRPAEFRGMKVPSMLVSGNHEEIEKWRKESSLRRTRKRASKIREENEHGSSVQH